MKLLDRLSSNTQLLSGGLRDFIWMLDMDKRSLQDLFDRLVLFGNNLFEHTEIAFNSKMTPEVEPEIHLNIDVRRHVIMIFKEAMHNSLKYSEASTTIFELDLQNGFVEFSFRDNGKGLDEHRVVSGYGLKNIKSRSQEIEGQLKISSNKNGTSIRLFLKIVGLLSEKNKPSNIILP